MSIKYEDFKTELLMNPKIRKEYEALKSEFDEIKSLIKCKKSIRRQNRNAMSKM